jgi:hypothetical protein
VAALLAALPQAELALWATAAYAGLRRGELRALRVSDLVGLDADAEDRYVNVERGWDDVDGAGPVPAASGGGPMSVNLWTTFRPGGR